MVHKLLRRKEFWVILPAQQRSFSRFKVTSKRKRNLAIGAFGVTSMVLVGVLKNQLDDLKRRLDAAVAVTCFDTSHRYRYVFKKRQTPSERKEEGEDEPLSIFHVYASLRLLTPWLHSHSHDPTVLLSLAQCDDHAVRLMGVRALAGDHNWTDEDYSRVAHALDGRALVGLARTANADKRFFLPPPPVHQNTVPLQQQLRELVSKLPLDNLDACTKHFTVKAMQDCPESKKLEQEYLWSIDGHGIYTEPSTTALDRMLVYSLRALVDFSYLPTHCTKVVNEGGLAILQRVCEARKESTKILRCVALIMSNLALHPELHAQIISTGWVGILHEWMNSRDLELSLKAAKALANLDGDFGGEKKYMEGVYLYYPQIRFSGPVYADIVFVHGLLGGPFRTWRQKDSVRVTTAKLKEREEKLKANAKKTSKLAGNTDSTNYKSSTKQAICQKPCRKCARRVSNESNQQTFSQCTCRNSVDSKTSDKNESKSVFNLDFGSIRSWNTKHKDKEKTEVKGLRPYTFCWPRDWLARDIPNARIISVGYETYLNEWEAECPYESDKRALMSRSYDMMEKLKLAGIGDRPVIWIGHSMGGLLIKQMLVNAKTDPRYQHMVEQSRGIVFYSVPHHGSQLADYAKRFKHIYAPSVEVKELVTGCPKLQELHEKFKLLMQCTDIPLLSFAEGRETLLPFKFKLVIVPEESCNPGMGEFHLMKELTHLNICKPESQQCAVYYITLRFLHDCVNFRCMRNILRVNLQDSSASDNDMS